MVITLCHRVVLTAIGLRLAEWRSVLLLWCAPGVHSLTASALSHSTSVFPGGRHHSWRSSLAWETDESWGLIVQAAWHTWVTKYCSLLQEVQAPKSSQEAASGYTGVHSIHGRCNKQEYLCFSLLLSNILRVCGDIPIYLFIPLLLLLLLTCDKRQQS